MSALVLSESLNRSRVALSASQTALVFCPTLRLFNSSELALSADCARDSDTLRPAWLGRRYRPPMTVAVFALLCTGCGIRKRWLAAIITAVRCSDIARASQNLS